MNTVGVRTYSMSTIYCRVDCKKFATFETIIFFLTLKNKEKSPTQNCSLKDWVKKTKCKPGTLHISHASLFFHGAAAPSGSGPHYRGFTIILRHTTLGRTPLDEWSARRRDLYLTIHNTHNRQTSMPPVGFEPIIPASEWPQTHALDCAATGIGHASLVCPIFVSVT
jgi:hypothetical protein